MTTKLGTLRYELACVHHFLEVPKAVRDEVGSDCIWELVREAVSCGITPKVVDVDFRNDVRRMREAQKMVAKSQDDEKHREAIASARELEKVVDRELKR